MISIVWFRKDLRLFDNPALFHAVAESTSVIPIFIDEEKAYPLGGASKWWLHHSLSTLSLSLNEKLTFHKGHPLDILQRICRDTGATQVYWNRRYEPSAIETDKKIKSTLEENGIQVKTYNSHLLNEPWTIKNNQGAYFKVFTPYWKRCMAASTIPACLATPSLEKITSIKGCSLDTLDLLPTKPDWAGGLRKSWVPGESGAQERLLDFIDNLSGYKDNRNRPDISATSRLSPHLTWGEISVRQIWYLIHKAIESGQAPEPDALNFLSEIGWREFSYHLLFHIPTLPTQPLQQKFTTFPWHNNPEAFSLWSKGLTGYPIVDAGMRELWHTGYMHNRVRMIVASFLIKDLLIPWQDGEAWFWDTLVDADLANNSASWQWAAGCGADASPYFRIFNPVLQGEKFDPKGTYVRRWVPELANLSDKFIHHPWTASETKLLGAGVRLGHTYPYPMIDHDVARKRALALYKDLQSM
ncbi:MAG: deoxyribodipyrimidine photo-lyase [Candidatus Paracaedibacteraceae bacterium]|nr:deoxyribodipyrimidine photo-lyase [Candidatus Paracaedibacteraceae bacterium]